MKHTDSTNDSSIDTSTTTRRQPRTEAQLLDLQEKLALRGMASTLQCLAEDACDATDVRARVRKSPFLSLAIAASIGALAGSFVGARTKSAPRGSRTWMASAGRFAMHRFRIGSR